MGTTTPPTPDILRLGYTHNQAQGEWTEESADFYSHHDTASTPHDYNFDSEADTVSTRDVERIMLRHQFRQHPTWRRIMPRLLVVARLMRLLMYVRRRRALQRALEQAGLGEYLLQEVMFYGDMFGLPPEVTTAEGAAAEEADEGHLSDERRARDQQISRGR